MSGHADSDNSGSSGGMKRINTLKTILKKAGVILVLALFVACARGSTALPVHDWTVRDAGGWQYGIVEYLYTAPLSDPTQPDRYEWYFEFGTHEWRIPYWFFGPAAIT